MIPPLIRKAALVSHISSSVGWIGALLAFLGLAVTAFATDDPDTVRALYVSMEVLGWTTLVPLAVASFSSGLVQALGSSWGLFRHYWVVVKLGITVVASVVLVAYTPTLALLADAAASAPQTDDALLPSLSPVLHAIGGLVVLLVATVLSVFKPRGLTRYGWRAQQRARAAAGT